MQFMELSNQDYPALEKVKIKLEEAEMQLECLPGILKDSTARDLPDRISAKLKPFFRQVCREANPCYITDDEPGAAGKQAKQLPDNNCWVTNAVSFRLSRVRSELQDRF